MKNTTKQRRLGLPNLGLGLGLRHVHFDYILKNWPAVDWFEVISENFIDSQGRPRYVLDKIAERYPVVMHGVSLSIGSTDPLNFEYLAKLKKLVKEIQPQWVSDHLCWTGVLGVNSHDLLPVSLNETVLKHVVRRIKIVQDFLERPLILENPSSYVSFKADTLSEWDFLKLMSEEADCGLLLDVNNVYVSAFNHDFDPIKYIQSLPHERIVQFHLAGHSHCGSHIVDTHDDKVVDGVWELYRLAYQLTDGVSTLLEWDANIPAFPLLLEELYKAEQYRDGGFITFDFQNESKEEKVREAIPHPLHLNIPEVE